jgi:hypothetical protein
VVDKLRFLRTAVVISLSVAFLLCRIALADDKANLRTWSEVRKLYVELESVSMGVDGSYQSQRVIRRTMAVTSDNKIHYFIGHAAPARNIDWKDEPFNFKITVSDQTLYEVQLFNRCFEKRAFPLGSRLPLAIQNDTFLYFAPVWLAKGYKLPRSRHLEQIVFTYAAQLENYTCKSLSFKSENCLEYTAANGSDRIVVSAEKENCVILRECFDPMSKARISSMTTKKVTHICGPLWVPSEVEFSYFESHGAEETVYRRAVTRVLDIRLNEEVSDDIFEQEVGAGYIQIEDKESRRFRQVSPGGTDHLEREADFCRTKFRLPERDSLWEKYKSVVILFIIGLVNGAILAWIPIGRILPRRTLAYR